MTEHERLKEIIDLIQYNCIFKIDGYTYLKIQNWGNGEEPVDVREIIFTPEFMGKLVEYYDNKTLLGNKRIYEQLGLTLLANNLNNPVDYLYNLLGLGTKQESK